VCNQDNNTPNIRGTPKPNPAPPFPSLTSMRGLMAATQDPPSNLPGCAAGGPFQQIGLCDMHVAAAEYVAPGTVLEMMDPITV